MSNLSLVASGPVPYEPHPFALMVPPMAEDRYLGLLSSVKESTLGVLTPVVIYNGMVLDGVHRQRAALACGKFDTMPIRVFLGTEEEAFEQSITLNRDRRHLSSTDLAIWGNEVRKQQAVFAKARMRSGKAPDPKLSGAEGQTGSAAEIAAKMTGASSASIKRVAQLEEHAADLLDEVKKGKKKLVPAVKELNERNPTKVRHTVHRAKAEPLVWGEAQEMFMEAVVKLNIPMKRRADAVKAVEGQRPVKYFSVLSTWKEWESQTYTLLFKTGDLVEQLMSGDHSGFHEQMKEFKNIVRLANENWKYASKATQTGTEKKVGSLVTSLQRIGGASHDPASGHDEQKSE